MTDSIEKCLKTFIHHVDVLGQEDTTLGDGFYREFKEIRDKQQAHKSQNKFPAEEGKKECNIKKNRYKDILPYDSHRVTLSLKDGVEGSDYINASFIEDVNERRGYIASQGPLPHTVNDFWRMLWEYRVEIVFMVCREEEQGKPKCQKYWAEKGETLTFGDITVTLKSENLVFPDFYERRLCAKCQSESHELTQFHYTGWPDHCVPKHSQEIYEMVKKMRTVRKKLETPLVIHCSAGCGRTGTICAVDYAWTLLDQGKVSKGFSMYDIILKIREQRQSMVQTPDQYEFVHLVMQSLSMDWLNTFQEHDYANEVPTDNETKESDNQEEDGDVYQEVAVQPAPISKQLDQPKKPRPNPRPPNPSSVSSDDGSEVNNNANTLKPKDKSRGGENYENVDIVAKTKQRLLSLSEAESNESVNTAARPLPEPLKPTAAPRSGHLTTIPIGGQAAAASTSQTPLPSSNVSQTQIQTHKQAVVKRSSGTAQVPTGSSELLKRQSSANELASSEEYGVVIKSATGKLEKYPESESATVSAGQKQREKPPLESKLSLGSQDEPPEIPERRYSLDDTDFKASSPTQPYPAGTVSAIGGGRPLPPNQKGPSKSTQQSARPPSPSTRPPASIPSNQPQLQQNGGHARVPSGGGNMLPRHHGGPEVVLGQPSRSPMVAVRGAFNVIGHTLGRGRTPAAVPAHLVQVPQGHVVLVPGASFPHRVRKPKGPRKFMYL